MLADKAWAPPRHLLYNLAERSGPEVFRMLQTGSLDLGWVIDVDRPRGLRFLPLETQEICCLLPRTSPLAQRERLTFPELASEAFAMNLEAPEDASVVSLLVARACREAGFMPKVSVNLRQFLPTPEVAQNLIEDGYGIMFGPAQAVQTLPRVAVRSMDPPLTVAVGVAWEQPPDSHPRRTEHRGLPPPDLPPVSRQPRRREQRRGKIAQKNSVIPKKYCTL